jgi:succinate-acetate transporter protein
MATTFEASRNVQQMEIMGVPGPADPAPLGLAGFALTTFLLSLSNAGVLSGGGGEWIGYAFAYGGLCQLLAGMWEFKNRNVFGATAFSTYGGFWIGLALYIELVAPTKGEDVTNDLAWILLAFFIFNTYMLLWSVFVNKAVLAVFFTLEITELILFIGQFSSTTDLIKAGGAVGIVTAGCAWYTSAAGVVNGMAGRHVLPVGKPMSFPAARSAIN